MEQTKFKLEDLFPKKIDFDLDCGDKQINFFFFGCWNQNRNATEKIIEQLNSDDASNYSFGIINGDNYYKSSRPDPENPDEKIKFDDMTTIQKGFDILKKSSHKLYLTLGNHEVDNKQTCETLRLELAQIPNSNIIFPHNYYSLHCYNNEGKHIKILFIDSNLFGANLCYDNNSSKLEKYKMLNWIEMHLKMTQPNVKILIVSHEPLFNIKIKKGVRNFVTNTLLDELFDLLTSPVIYTDPNTLELIPIIRPIYFFASDIHNYQYWKCKNITQIIAGTGGANLDDIENSNEVRTFTSPNREDTIYDIFSSNMSYGYLKVQIIDDNIDHTFIPIIVPPSTGIISLTDPHGFASVAAAITNVSGDEKIETSQPTEQMDSSLYGGANSGYYEYKYLKYSSKVKQMKKIISLIF